MKIERVVLPAIGFVGLIVFFATGCESNSPDEISTSPVANVEEIAKKKSESHERKIVTGLLMHFPQDVKSTEAWLGHEFLIGETPIRPTEKVPHDVLMSLVGENIEVAGRWNPGKKREPPKPTEEDFYLQSPSFPEWVTVIIGSGIEASSVRKVEK